MIFFARYQGLSDPLRTERRVELIVLIFLVLLLLQFGWGSYRALFPPIPDPVRPMRDSLQVANVQGLSVVSPEQRAQIRQRPLFWASRAPVVLEPVKPEPEPKKANTAKPGKIENVKLAGVFGGGDTGGVIVISKGKKRRLAVGEELDGWKLQSVEAFSANFGSGDQQATLALSIVEISQAQASEGQVQPDGQALDSGKSPGAKSKSNRKSKKKTEVSGRLRLGGGNVDGR
ncbi:hypothetical protein EYC87_00980 [Halieaceae bacterium IMCC8485]|jgi:hypothetical protein|uniref:Type II secretion system protein GspC N-terminal domain-containing protein n=1 Tax=Candidatus Seongchinamella marina TaxID=2518990 RepID=A0ABT3SQ91_9GAMM|nr:hypothetical protein [Candidatus Seongchinamella marina]MCX2972158.1 hypothetical protein [Candidatus Seongchinamella marina]